MRRSAVVLAAFLAAPLAVSAAGLGRLAVMSRVGEPLNAEIDVVSIQGKEGESLAARVAPPEVYRSAHIAPVPPVEALRATVERRADGRPVVRITSTGPVDKPLVNLLVELSWAGGTPIVRQYSFLLDTLDRKPPPVVFTPSTGTDTAPPRIGEPLPPPSDAASPPPAPSPAATPPAAAAAPQSAPASPQVALAAPKAAPAPPQTAPAPPPAAPAAAVSESGGTYAVQSGDSFLKIAQATRYEGVSFAQMVVAIHRANEDAFIGGDMSRLKSGYTLKIPSREEVARVNADEARQTVAALRGQPEPVRPQPEPARSRPIAREPGPAGDDVVARERALAESRDRASALEQTRDDLKRLLEAREREIADLERQVGKDAGKSQPIKK
jgi:pilus assembly protein FimV